MTLIYVNILVTFFTERKESDVNFKYLCDLFLRGNK